MNKFLFTREITSREAINRFGKLGFVRKKEGVIIEAESLDAATEILAPFNWKKHIKFTIDYDFKANYDSMATGIILDLGRVD